jgi:hypothetical protein
LKPSTSLPLPLYKALTRSAIPLAAARTLVGAVVFARPTLLATSLGVDAITAERTAWIARLFAGRDLALGVGAVAGSRGCQIAACASDASDLLAVVAAIKAGHVRPTPAILAAVTAAGAAVAGAAALFVTRN